MLSPGRTTASKKPPSPSTKARAKSRAKARTPPRREAPRGDAPPIRGVISPEALRFIGELARRQNRAWFEPRKEELKRLLHDPVLAVLRDAGGALIPHFPAVEDAAPRVFRIYRDVRFAKDKSPYKDHVGGTLKVGLGDVYLHVDGSGLFAAVGVYDPSPAQLAAFRQAVADTELGPALLATTAALERRGYTLMSIGALARAPAGYSPDHHCIRLLRLKGWALKLPPIPVRVRADGSLGAHIARGVAQAREAIALAERAFASQAPRGRGAPRQT